MLTDAQFAAKHIPESTCTYYTFGFVPCNPHTAIGMIEHTRLGATRYYIQTGTLTNNRWREVERDQYHSHCKAI